MLTHDLEEAVGYRFQNITLLQNALTHSSYANERWRNSLASNERLEFLGDAVLGVTVAEYLYRNFPKLPEGDLTRTRADLVCEKTLARAANAVGLGKHLLLGHGEEQCGGRTRDSILADATEAVIAAAFLDGGWPAAQGIIYRLILNHVPEVRHPRNVDYKTMLQELVQQKKDQTVTYVLSGESGPDHAKEFTVELLVNDTVAGRGAGSSKKRAEQAAARAALEAMYPEKLDALSLE